MKKLFAYAAPLVMAMSFTVAPTTLHANPGGSNAAAKACNSGLADAIGVSVGTCVKLFKDGDAVSVCKALKDLGLLDLVGARNQGQCIKALS
jgi:hypothetical protein